MDRDTFQKKFDELTEELFFDVSAEANRLYRSGAVDTESYPDDMTLPRLLLHVALLNQAEKVKPRDAKSRGEIANLKKF